MSCATAFLFCGVPVCPQLFLLVADEVAQQRRVQSYRMNLVHSSSAQRVDRLVERVENRLRVSIQLLEFGSDELEERQRA